MVEPAAAGACVPLALAIFSVISIGAVISAKADEDDLKKGLYSDGRTNHPVGCLRIVVPALNPGLSFDPIFTVGQAVTTAISPSGTPPRPRCFRSNRRSARCRPARR